jgi:predicted AAA+ superfamily ATPase
MSGNRSHHGPAVPSDGIEFRSRHVPFSRVDRHDQGCRSNADDCSPSSTARSAAPALEPHARGGAHGPAVVDEVQRAPELFPVLRVLIDRSDAPGQLLLLGSASPALLRQTSESLLGRVEVVEVAGLDLAEVGVERQQGLWLRGGFPPSFLARSDADSLAWRLQAVQRQVKAPKPYFRDSGLLHALVGIGDFDALMAHPRGGASWEGLVVEPALRIAQPEDACFWATHAGTDLDLLLFKSGRRVGVEIKRMDAPRLTPSMQIALHDLELDALDVVYPGERRYRLADRVEVMPLEALLPEAGQTLLQGRPHRPAARRVTAPGPAVQHWRPQPEARRWTCFS